MSNDADSLKKHTIAYPEWLPASVKKYVEEELQESADLMRWLKDMDESFIKQIREDEKLLERLCTNQRMMDIFNYLSKSAPEKDLSLSFFQEVFNLNNQLDFCKPIPVWKYKEWIDSMEKAASRLYLLLKHPPHKNLILPDWLTKPLSLIKETPKSGLMNSFIKDAHDLEIYKEPPRLSDVISRLAELLLEESQSKPKYSWELDGTAIVPKKIKDKMFHQKNMFLKLKLFLETRLGPKPCHDKIVAIVTELALDLPESINIDNVRKQT